MDWSSPGKGPRARNHRIANVARHRLGHLDQMTSLKAKPKAACLRGAQAVRNHERSPAGHEPLHGLHDHRLGREVNGARGLVKDQDRASLRKARASEMRCRSPPERLMPRSPTLVSYPSGSEVMNSWHAPFRRRQRSCRALHRPWHRDVLADRSREEQGFLEDDTELVPEIRQPILAEVDPIEKDLAVGGVREARQQVHQG